MYKKYLFSIMAACASLQCVQAVPAFPHPRTVKQADGRQLTIMTKGDEHGHWTSTSDGLPLYYNTATANYEYAVVIGGELAGTGVAASETNERDDAEQAFLSTYDGTAVVQSLLAQRTVRMNRSKGVQRIRVNNLPAMGEKHLLTILVEFSDCKFTTVGDDPAAFYKRMLNEEGFTYTNGATGSVRDYYVASSFGKFLPMFDVIGPITLPNDVAYYGANTGGGDNAGRIQELLTTACELVDDKVDFSQYDTDGDGRIDNICIFYAGYGEADSGKDNTIWPHSATLSTTKQFDGKTIGNYACINEESSKSQTAGIGVFVHEFGHVLGLADHYDVMASSVSAYNYTPGYYDVMAYGSDNNNGNTPPLFSSYERAEIGWLDYTELTDKADSVNVLTDLKASNMAYRVSVPGNENEFFVLENRQQTGWDAYLPGHGMLMWHIDLDETAWMNNQVNTNSSHQRIDIVEADNRRTADTRDGDTFPGASNVMSWQMTSWDGADLLYLDDIDERNGNIEIVLGGLDLMIATPKLNIVGTTENSITLAWDDIDMADTYTLGIKDADTGTTVEEFDGKNYDSGQTIVIDGLQPETNYTVSLTAQRGSYKSATATATVATTAIPFAKLRPENIKVSDVNNNGFTAAWDAVDGADYYVLTLRRHVYDSTMILRGYDFSNNATGLPNLWETNGGTYMSVSGCYGEAAPSLRFARSGGSIVIAYPESRICSVVFWGKGNDKTDGKVFIERYEDGAWVETDSFSPTNEAATYTFTFDACDKVRIRLESNSGVFYIDDIVVACSELSRTTVSETTTNTTSHTFSDLEKGATYGLTVVAKQGEENSLESPETVVTTGESAGITTINGGTGNGHTDIYDLQGRRLTTTPQHGIYIIRQDGKTLKNAVRRK